MHIDLEKRSEQVAIILEKNNIPKGIVLRVACALDKSLSAKPFYQNGQMQELTDRLLGVSYNFDDNGEIDMWLFHNESIEAPAVSQESYGNYVNNEIMGNPRLANSWGGTEYAPVMNDITSHYFPSLDGKNTETEEVGFFGKLFGKKKEEKVDQPVVSVDDLTGEEKIPALVLFITDGQNQDEGRAEKIINETKDKPIYWMMVGVGPESEFGFIKKMADRYDHVGMVVFNDLDITDEVMYQSLLNGELSEWIKKRG